MEPSEQQRYLPIIEKRLAEVAQELSDLEQDTEAVAPDSAVGRLSRMDTIQIQQMAVAQRERLQNEQGRLRAALARIDRGEFGRCQLCGQDVVAERLEIQPDAVVCVPCAKKRK